MLGPARKSQVGPPCRPAARPAESLRRGLARGRTFVASEFQELLGFSRTRRPRTRLESAVPAHRPRQAARNVRPTWTGTTAGTPAQGVAPGPRTGGARQPAGRFRRAFRAAARVPPYGAPRTALGTGCARPGANGRRDGRACEACHAQSSARPGRPRSANRGPPLARAAERAAIGPRLPGHARHRCAQATRPAVPRRSSTSQWPRRSVAAVRAQLSSLHAAGHVP